MRQQEDTPLNENGLYAKWHGEAIKVGITHFYVVVITSVYKVINIKGVLNWVW
jgi:hypothetical protein